jgi:hypothetical protein
MSIRRSEARRRKRTKQPDYISRSGIRLLYTSPAVSGSCHLSACCWTVDRVMRDLPSQNHPGGGHGYEAPIPRYSLAAFGFAIVEDVDIVALTGGHFAVATRLRRRRGWWPVRDSVAVRLTMTAEVSTREMPTQRRKEQREKRD